MSKTIAIIGGGFCGTLLAVHLLSHRVYADRVYADCIDADLHIVLINRSGLLARGVAYGTRTQTQVGTVINCTGPNSNMRRSQEPLLMALEQRGLLRPDPLGLGIGVADNYAVVDASGAPSPALYYVGPFLKAHYWEATAVPELREHVQRLAQVLLADLA